MDNLFDTTILLEIPVVLNNHTHTQRRINLVLFKHCEFILRSPSSINCISIRFKALAKCLGSVHLKKWGGIPKY